MLGNMIFTEGTFFFENFTSANEILAWQQLLSYKTTGLRSHRTKYDNFDKHNFPLTIPEFWVCFKHLKNTSIDILKYVLVYVMFFWKTRS